MRDVVRIDDGDPQPAPTDRDRRRRSRDDRSRPQWRWRVREPASTGGAGAAQRLGRLVPRLGPPTTGRGCPSAGTRTRYVRHGSAARAQCAGRGRPGSRSSTSCTKARMANFRALSPNSSNVTLGAGVSSTRVPPRRSPAARASPGRRPIRRPTPTATVTRFAASDSVQFSRCPVTRSLLGTTSSLKYRPLDEQEEPGDDVREDRLQAEPEPGADGRHQPPERSTKSRPAVRRRRARRRTGCWFSGITTSPTAASSRGWGRRPGRRRGHRHGPAGRAHSHATRPDPAGRRAPERASAWEGEAGPRRRDVSVDVIRFRNTATRLAPRGPGGRTA